MSRSAAVALVCFCICVTGCLPSSCKRVESRELFAADSLSRQLASQIPEDTLSVYGLTFGSDDAPLEYPRSIQFDDSGMLWVADVVRGSIVVMDDEGNFVREIPGEFELPFMAGSSRDSVFVFDASHNSISALVDTSVQGTVFLSGIDIPDESVRYATVMDNGYALKIVPKEDRASIVFFDRDGIAVSSFDLPGEAWQWAGFLRNRPASITSLRGYQPRIDFVRHDGQLDSLDLVGFDSPMLARMRSYMRGDANAPPLLTPSSTFVADRLFALNIRPGWTRVDVYDRSGMLTDILIREKPAYNKDYFPTDIAVVRKSEQTFVIAVAYVEPDAGIETYEWTDTTK